MQFLNEAVAYLEAIKNKEISFTNVINKKINTLALDSDELEKLKGTLKSVINCYHFLFWEINSHFFEKDETVKDALIVSLAALRYVKNVDESAVKEFLTTYKENKSLDFDVDEAMNFLLSIKAEPTPIPEKYEKAFAKKMALKYAYPEWVVRMLIKHFGIKHTFKSLVSSRKAVKLSLSVNPLKTNVFDVVNNNSDFTLGKLGSLSMRYGGKTKLIEYAAFKDNEYFMMDESNQFAIDQLEPLDGEEVFVYGDAKGLMACDLALMMNDIGRINTCLTNINDLNVTRNMIRRFGLRSIYAFEEASSNLLITHIGPNSLDKMLLLAPSSELGLIRRNPDILLTLKREDLDGIIDNQRKLLEETATFIKEEGILLYMVKTMNKKESTKIIEEFLTNHPEFTLVDERQIFPYEYFCDGFYYAKLKKTGKNE